MFLVDYSELGIYSWPVHMYMANFLCPCSLSSAIVHNLHLNVALNTAFFLVLVFVFSRMR